MWILLNATIDHKALKNSNRKIPLKYAHSPSKNDACWIYALENRDLVWYCFLTPDRAPSLGQESRQGQGNLFDALIL